MTTTNQIVTSRSLINSLTAPPQHGHALSQVIAQALPDADKNVRIIVGGADKLDTPEHNDLIRAGEGLVRRVLVDTARSFEVRFERDGRADVIDPRTGMPIGYEQMKRTVVLDRRGAEGSCAFSDLLLGVMREQGARVLNTPEASALAADKAQTMRVLCAEKLPVPPTVVFVPGQMGFDALQRALGVPQVLIKPAQATEAEGVALVGSAKVFESHLVGRAGEVWLAQQPVGELGTSYRAVVAGKEVIACVKMANPGRVCSNAAQGGEVTSLASVPASMQSLAGRAMSALGLTVGAVDFVLDKGEDGLGLSILEVNSAMDWAMTARACPGVRIGERVLAALLDGPRGAFRLAA
ncbi:MAG: hypothetical protein AAGI37_05680 [Planctomycetota bacterium]